MRNHPRNIVDMKDISFRSIVGMPWCHWRVNLHDLEIIRIKTFHELAICEGDHNREIQRSDVSMWNLKNIAGQFWLATSEAMEMPWNIHQHGVVFLGWPEKYLKIRALFKIWSYKKDVPGPSILGVKWFRYRVSIHHPLGFKDGTPTGRCWYMSAWSATMEFLTPFGNFRGQYTGERWAINSWVEKII